MKEFLKKHPALEDRSPEELAGVKKRSFVLPFAGGEIRFEHLDGMYQYTELAVRKLRADAAEFCRPSSTGHIAFVLDETTVTDELISEIAAALIGSGKRFMRAAFVGADGLSRKKLKKSCTDTASPSASLTASNRQRNGSWMSGAFEGQTGGKGPE